MKKRLMTVGLVLLVLLTVLPVSVWAAPGKPTAAEKEQTIAALQAMMVGIRFDSERNEKVSYWSDSVIIQSICNKLLWEEKLVGDTVYLQKMELTSETSEEGEIGYPLDLVKQLAFDIYGNTFSKSSQSEGIRIAEEKLWITPGDEAYEQLRVLDYEQTGDRLLAVGMAVAYEKNSAGLKDYFVAEFKRNADCVYGYTIQSLSKLDMDTGISGLTATASGFLKNDSQYAAEKVLDGSKKTAWVEGAKGLGVNEWIRLDTEDGSEMTIQTIELRLGYQKSDSTLQKNGWPSKLLLQAAEGWQQEVEFSDYNDVIVLEEPLTTPWVRFTIMRGEAGSTYEDVAISEIRLSNVDPQQAFDTYWEAIVESPDSYGKIETLYDGDVIVSRSPGFDPGTKLLSPVLIGEKEQEALRSFADGELKSYAIYDLSIQLQDGTNYQEEKRILEIRLPVPDQEQETGWMVYRIGEEGHTRIEFEYADGYAIIRTRELGRYIVTTLNKGEQAGEAGADETTWQLSKDVLITVIVIVMIVVLLAGAGAILMLVLRRRDDWDEDEDDE